MIQAAACVQVTVAAAAGPAPGEAAPQLYDAGAAGDCHGDFTVTGAAGDRDFTLSHGTALGPAFTE